MLVEIASLALGMATVAGVVVTLGTLGGTCGTPYGRVRRQELLLAVLAERFRWEPGDPVDDSWAAPMSRALREHEIAPDAKERRQQMVALGLRLQGEDPTPTAIGRVARGAEALESRALRRLEDVSATAPDISTLLGAWRLQSAIEAVRSVVSSLRLALPATLRRIGVRAATLIGLGSAATVVTTVMGWALVEMRTPLVDLAGQWVAVVSVVMVGLLVVLETRDHVLPELGRGGHLGGWVLVVALALGLPTVFALAHRRGWLAAGAQMLDDRIGSWAASPTVGAVAVLLFVLVPVAGAMQHAWRWRVPPSNRSAPGQRSDRVEAIVTATGFALLAAFGVSAVAGAMALLTPLSLAFFGVVVVGAATVLSLRGFEHLGRVKDLRQAGKDPARGTFRWWIVGLAVLGPGLLDLLALAVGPLVEHAAVAPGGAVRAITLTVVFSLAMIVAAFAVPGVLLWQIVAAVRRYRRVVRHHRALVWEMRIHARRVSVLVKEQDLQKEHA